MDLIKSDRALRELYARWLDIATKAGFVISLAAFLLYAGQVLPAYVPVSELPRYWSLPVNQFIQATGAPSGWAAWLGELGYGDGLNLLADVVDRARANVAARGKSEVDRCPLGQELDVAGLDLDGVPAQELLVELSALCKIRHVHVEMDLCAHGSP